MKRDMYPQRYTLSFEKNNTKNIQENAKTFVIYFLNAGMKFVIDFAFKNCLIFVDI